MTYKIDEHTEFWGGKHLAQTVKQSVAEFNNLPTAAEIKADVAKWATGHGIGGIGTLDDIAKEDITRGAQGSTVAYPSTAPGANGGVGYATSTADLRKQLDAWPTSQNITKEAVKHDDGKPDWSLVPFESLEGMVKVLEFGAQKYAGWNWTTNGGFPYMRVLRSCLRHLFAWSRGEDKDPESGLSHIHHAMCNLLFISHYIGNKEKYNKDDRQVR